MPIGTTGSVGTEIPAGTQVRFAVREAAFEPDGKYGPDIELDLDVLTPDYIGTEIKYWAKIARPRLDKVARLRGDGVDDESIAAILRKQGFEFDRLEEADEMLVARGGALYKILTAGQGNAKGAEKVLQSVNSFAELAARLVGVTFVGIVKTSKDGYAKLDAKEDIFVDKEALSDVNGSAGDDEDFDSIPF